MIVAPLGLHGAFTIDLETLTDDRGFFARSFCATDLEPYGLDVRIAQCNVSYNERRGTLRGLHYQVEPHAEAKYVRCTAGEIWDVVVDLRADSPTFHQWEAVTLSAQNRRTLYVPAGFAHGFLTLTDEAEVLYMMTEFYVPGAARGIRWDDPAIGIDWPYAPAVIGERDASYPDID